MVTSGFNQLRLATKSNMEATKQEAANAKLDFFTKRKPANIVANVINITDSYALLHGA